jgi:hypothetical protein
MHTCAGVGVVWMLGAVWRRAELGTVAPFVCVLGDGSVALGCGSWLAVTHRRRMEEGGAIGVT